jgi:membrane protein DedA with SNARE-associated domain
MLDTIVSGLAGAIVATISAAGYAGVLLLMAVESACIPLPSEVIMPFAGYLASTGRFSLPLVATVGALGCNLGSAVAYAVGHRGGRSAIERWGRYVLLSPRDLERAERWFARFGGITVLIGRLLPVVRTFIALPAGLAGMPLGRFHLYTFLGSWPWCFVLAWIGYRLGERWQSDPRLRDLMHRFDLVIVALLVLLVGWHVWRHWRERTGPVPP